MIAADAFAAAMFHYFFAIDTAIILRVSPIRRADDIILLF